MRLAPTGGHLYVGGWFLTAIDVAQADSPRRLSTVDPLALACTEHHSHDVEHSSGPPRSNILRSSSRYLPPQKLAGGQGTSTATAR